MFKIRSEADAVTERSPAYAILAIDSEDRFKNYVEQRLSVDGGYNDSPYNFQITKNESMMNGFFTRLALTEICFPWSLPNINKTTQKILFNYAIAGVPQPQQTITLTIGFNRPSQIASALQSAIIAIDPVNLALFTVEYGNLGIPSFLFASNSAPITFSFSPLPYNSAIYPFPNTTKQLYDILGLDISTAGTPSILSLGVQGGYTLCQAVRYIDVTCNQLTYNQALKDTMSQTVARDTLCRLYVGDGPYTGTSTLSPIDPLFCPPGCAPFVIYRQFTNPKFIRWLPNQPVQGNLQFAVFDDAGAEYNRDLSGLVPGLVRLFQANWSMTLLVSED